MTQNPLNDAMPGRAFTARWVVRGTLTLESAMHLGGGGGERTDMPVLRDSRTGKPLLPGTTLAGCLRNALTDRLAGYLAGEPPEVCALFGAGRGETSGDQSPLIIFDALGDFPNLQGYEIRDGVAIAAKTGVAEDNKKFDFEVLPPGTRFPVRLDVLVPKAAGSDDGDPVYEKRLLELLSAAVDSLSKGDQPLGMRRSRGLGRVRGVWSARRYLLSTPAGWMEWILSDHEEPLGAIPDQPCIRTALANAAPDELKPLAIPEDARSSIFVDLQFSLERDILIRSANAEPGNPDVSHLRSGGAPVLAGTSLSGVIRSQAVRISRLVRAEKGDADKWVDRLFGPRFEGRRPAPGQDHWASRLRITENQITGSTLQQQTRVAIDRFTGGAAETALFEEQTEVGGSVPVRLELRNPEDGELGLMLLVVKDLLEGFLPVGGTSAIGRGLLRGSAVVSWQERNTSELATEAVRLEPGKAPTGKAAGKIDSAIKSFHNAIPLQQ